MCLHYLSLNNLRSSELIDRLFRDLKPLHGAKQIYCDEGCDNTFLELSRKETFHGGNSGEQDPLGIDLRYRLIFGLIMITFTKQEATLDLGLTSQN